MVTLESGRVRPDDAATIKLVLTAVNQIRNNQYSILVNKTTENVKDLFKTETKKDVLMSYFVPASVGARTFSLFFVPMIQELMDQENKWKEIPDLRSFISTAPEIKIPANSISSIQYLEFEKMVQELREEMQQLHGENAALRQDIEATKIKFPLLKEHIKKNHPSLASFFASNNDIAPRGKL